MKWTIDYREEEKIVYAKITGVMSWEQHKKFAEEIYPMAISKGSHKVFIDFRNMTPKCTVLQIDDMPNLLRELGVGPEFRIAAVHKPSSRNHEFTFFRNSASIRSIQVRQFNNADEAVAWLKSEA